MFEKGKRMRIAVFCVGNRLHGDDGVGPAVYDILKSQYEIPENVILFDVGVMTMDLITYVDTCDVVIAVDAVEGTEEEVGTIVRFRPEDAQHSSMYNMSLHDLKLADLFVAATLVGYEAEGVCLGMQVAETEPEYLTEELSPAVQAALPALVETLLAELSHHGIALSPKQASQE